MTNLWIIENEDTGVPVRTGDQKIVTLSEKAGDDHAQEWTNANAHLGGYYRARKLTPEENCNLSNFTVLARS